MDHDSARTSHAASLMEIRCSHDGAFDFSPPLQPDDLAGLRGERLAVEVDGIAFTITLDERIALPKFCRTIQDAKYFAACLSFQIISQFVYAAGRAPDRRSAGAARGADVVRVEPSYRAATGSLRFSDLMSAWRRNHLMNGGAPTTPPYWETLVGRFVDFLGHDDPAQVTAQDVRRYRDHLIASGRLLRTARDSDLTALRSIYKFAVESELLDANPLIGVKLKGQRLATARRMSAFTEAEAQAILAAADREAKPLRRWVPWLTAMTGSRVATMVNLRRQDVALHDGVWCVTVSREAGPVKTAASERIVPLHPALLERGFVAFVQAQQRDYLFVDHTRDGYIVDGRVMQGPDARPYNPGRSNVNRLTEWTRGLGLAIGRKNGKDPNHAWRHWFKERAFSVGIPEKITDMIVGHAQMSTSRRYGAIPLAVMQAELAKIASPIPWRQP